MRLAWAPCSLAFVGAVSLGACLLDFEPYDPRIADAVSSAASGGSGTTSSSLSSGGTMSGITSESSATTGGAPSVGGSGGTGGSGPQIITYSPTVADCIYPSAPNPDTCAIEQPMNTIGVDLSGTAMQEIRSYLRFDLDNQLAGKQIVSVKLELTVNSVMGAESVSSGIVDQVTAFDHTSLFTTVPTNLSQLAGDQGMVVLSMTVEWTLPAGVAAPNTALYLGIIPINTDGVDYNNNLTTLPPRLRVTVQ